MKLSIFSAAQLCLLASAFPQNEAAGDLPEGEWRAGGADDFRGPCPMMNTLANHGFLPRDGRNITRENAIHALGNGISFDAELAGIMWDQAVIANPEPNATFFTLDNLNRHNVLEHDASLSRSDAFFGNNHVFNQSVFDTSTVYWTTDILTPQQIANSKLARQITSRAYNPDYTFSTNTEAFSIGEIAAPFIVFGTLQDPTAVEKKLVTYFFENERLPSELGWTKKEVVTLNDILGASEILTNATSLFTEAAAAPHKLRRRDLHAAF
ncbi:hypothetical protein Daus18300_010859 [Diaporthe australafricana]|uniref:Heme haloperoxidase family profile domain-containing protein n=1 Tax=Diaporthe australafricana TaxID=127596 RepID=A0ABR3W8W9_9PEZI